ncbi:response regulator transcription factor [Christiangramia echinicola]|uniref:DNA-binding response regulator, OmpR family, contains REC and winged-helix (WHTH) domain n=1 Tax=Christiangramia echinicola TaxID=279359 RepID=A0A1H1KXD0_9FLAO|nr:response regulator transcription factor [Christiangramia echinicola]SDR66700.1 DNA-binding response regulator, OmpR family, contains REC and winged-helix (wHTH) domain [Christiangramia echinicola]
MKILIIEDEKDMLQNMQDTLVKQGYIVESASDLDSAISKVGVYDYDCILLDINLPDGSGMDILNFLKKNDKTEGVIIVSARNSLDDRIRGLNTGADDYIAKPFHMAELNARVKALLRRKNFEGSDLLKIGNLCIDSEKHTSTTQHGEMELNRKEFDILTYLATNQDRLVSKSALAEHVWGDHIDQADNFEFIYSQIKNLRKKLKEVKADIEIKAVYGIGYKLTLS